MMTQLITFVHKLRSEIESRLNKLVELANIQGYNSTTAQQAHFARSTIWATMHDYDISLLKELKTAFSECDLDTENCKVIHLATHTIARNCYVNETKLPQSTKSAILFINNFLKKLIDYGLDNSQDNQQAITQIIEAINHHHSFLTHSKVCAVIKHQPNPGNV